MCFSWAYFHQCMPILSIVGIEIHLSWTFHINVTDPRKSLVLSEASAVTLRIEMGSPLSEGISGYLALLAVYLGKFSLGTDTLEMEKENFNSWSTHPLKENPWVFLVDSLSNPFYSKRIPPQLDCSRIIFCIYIYMSSICCSLCLRTSSDMF